MVLIIEVVYCCGVKSKAGGRRECKLRDSNLAAEVVPDYAHLIPEPIRQFTTRGVYDSEENQHLSFIQGSGHGGSHPHLAHEFISAITEGRDPFPNVYQSSNWTCAGICAHMSAMKNGEVVKLPVFR